MIGNCFLFLKDQRKNQNQKFLYALISIYKKLKLRGKDYDK